MLKKLPIALVAATLLVVGIDYPQTTIAGTCASKCGPRPLQFTPGQKIRVELTNNTKNVIEIEKIRDTKAIPLNPGDKIQLEYGDGTEPNISLIFWDKTGAALRAEIAKPNFGTLSINLHPSGKYPGDRALYIRNDGRVNIL
ncbi:hypothetical protein [Anabaena sp. CA = ATCC 33047]|uniref:hypothetical protein n=1 Tax=Anabaena sp. (strain CA / ATCC 33047) TaxID=52271 RepID=UPI0008365B12|nr:hypothetical protein [Anabaena sp. CA = ATCC 33047]